MNDNLDDDFARFFWTAFWIVVVFVIAVTVSALLLLGWAFTPAHASGSSTLGPTVQPLFSRGRPPTVGGFIVPIVVNSVDAFAGRARPHVLDEADKSRLSVFSESPVVTYSNVSPAIVLETKSIPIVATPDHGFPETIQQSFTFAVGSRSTGSNFGVVATTRSGFASSEVTAENNLDHSTVALTLPSNYAPAGRQRGMVQIKDSPPTVFVSDKINRFSDVSHLMPIHQAPSGFQYPSECCNETDCHPVSCEALREVEGGVQWLEWKFVSTQIRRSEDGYCHVCIGHYGPSPAQARPHCVFMTPRT